MANQSKLVFINADGEIENSTVADTLVYDGGLKSADDTASVQLDIKSGNASAGDSGDVRVQSGTATGTRGTIVLDGAAIDANSTQIINVAEPTAPQHAATKAYADGLAEGLAPKESVRVASAAILSGTMTTDNVAPTTGNRSYNTTTKAITWFATQGPTAVDGIVLANGDRILVMSEDATSGPSAGEGRKYNGIYVRTSLDVWTRAIDFDEATPTNEIAGAYVPASEGTVNEGKFFVQSGTFTTLDTDNINFVFFNAIAAGVIGGAGIDFTTGVVSVDLAAGSGLDLVGAGNAAQLSILLNGATLSKSVSGLKVATSGITSAQIAGNAVLDSHINFGVGATQVNAVDLPTLDSGAYFPINTVESSLDGLAAQVGGLTSTTFGFTEDNVLADNDTIYAALDKLDLKWGDIASTANTEGASLIGAEDAAGIFTGTNVEAQLQEVMALALTGGSENYTVGAGGVAGGDLLVFSGSNTVNELDNQTGSSSEFGFGIAASTQVAAASVDSLHDGQKVTGILDGTTFAPGDKVYYDSSQAGDARYVTLLNAPSGVGSKVWQVGLAATINDLLIDINFIKKNA